MELSDPKIIRSKLMDYLARREHSEFELKSKLGRKVSSIKELERQIENLKKNGLIDDHRFSEAYIASRQRKGFGPVRISQELIQRGVKEEAFMDIIDSIDWLKSAQQVLLKKSKGKELNDKKIEIKLKQFLSYRGFNFFQIENAIETFNRNEMVDGQS